MELYLPPEIKPDYRFNPRKWTDADIEYLKENYALVSNRELERKMKRSVSSIIGKAHKLNLKKNPDVLERIKKQSYFKKGLTPWNKNKKGLNMGVSSTRFSRGQKPKNWKPEGTITIRSKNEGEKYKYIKNDGVWVLLHRLVWQQHGREIPPGMVIRFKDGDSMNCDIENLELISRSENMLRNYNREKQRKTMKETWRRIKIRHQACLPAKSKLQRVLERKEEVC